MEKLVYYTKLFDSYKGLLNDNEQTTFSSYYENDLSMQEIADNKGVSKSAIGATIKTVEMKLTNFEKILHLEEKEERLAHLMSKITEENIKSEIESIIKM